MKSNQHELSHHFASSTHNQIHLCIYGQGRATSGCVTNDGAAPETMQGNLVCINDNRFLYHLNAQQIWTDPTSRILSPRSAAAQPKAAGTQLWE